MSADSVPVPKWLQDDPIAHAQYLRHGVTHAIAMRTGRIVPSYRGYVHGSSAGFRYADRVRMAWMRRHPKSTDSGQERT